jgi:hypothetical protein
VRWWARAGVYKTFTSTIKASVPSDLSTSYERRVQVGPFNFVKSHDVFFLAHSISSFRSHVIKSL